MSIKKLVGETAIYGISSILGRILNFALVPFYTQLLPPEEYGIVIEIYAVVAFLMVFFTYRMEVAYFRFGTDLSLDRRNTFNTSLTSLIVSTLILGGIFTVLAPYYAAATNLQPFLTYLYICIGILCIDALCELPYAELRLSGRPIRFAAIRIANITVNLGLNLFFLWFCPKVLDNNAFEFLHPFIHSVYNPNIGIGYIFISNVVASLLSLVLLLPLLRQYKFLFDQQLWRKMMRYVLPLVLVGIAYLINENLDKILMRKLIVGSEFDKKFAIGVYGTNYKLAILIALFTQAFRYGAEPFFFKNKKEHNAKELYAAVAKYFLIFGLVGFLVITLYIDIFKHLIRDKTYWEGLKIVPIVLLANVLAGLYYNFSVWYKLLDKTQWGAYISGGGAIITIVLNIWWIPIIGYMGSAWATLICYTTMTVVCYLIGRRYYPIPYSILSMLSYLALAVGLYLLNEFFRLQVGDNFIATLGINTLLLSAYLGVIYWREKNQIWDILKTDI